MSLHQRQRGRSRRTGGAGRAVRLAGRAALVGASALLWWSCVDPEPVTPEQVCDDVRRAIALRTQACTSDPELANKRYETAQGMKCKLTTVDSKTAYDCSAATLGRSCEEVTTLGDDVEQWVSQMPCSGMFDPIFPAGGGPLLREACVAIDGGCQCKTENDPRFSFKGVCDAANANVGSGASCCATEGYPAGGSCTCRGIYCQVTGQEGNRACSCSVQPVSGGLAAPGCSAVSFPDIDGVCCLRLGGQECFCSRSDSCPSETSPVASCDPSLFCSFSVGPERQGVTRCSL